MRVLELGSGTGLFWLANRDRIVPSWDITVSDYSEGMLETARGSLSPLGRRFRYEIVNAEDIPYPAGTFDVVLANNMLYHVQNRDGALKNINRILKPDGVFIASAMGKDDLAELHHHLYVFLAEKNIPFRFTEYSFSLDNGGEQLAKHFGNVRLEKHGNALAITEADAIVQYYLSFNGIYDNVEVLPEAYADDFAAYLRRKLPELLPSPGALWRP